MDNTDIESLTAALREVAGRAYGFLLCTGDPVLFLFKQPYAHSVAWLELKRSHPKVNGAVGGTARVHRGKLILDVDPSRTKGTPTDRDAKKALEQVRRLVNLPLLKSGRLKFPEDPPEDGEEENVPPEVAEENVWKLRTRWPGEGDEGKRSPELQTLDEAVEALRSSKSRTTRLERILRAQEALEAWRAKKSKNNPRLELAKELEADLAREQALTRLSIASGLVSKSDPAGLVALLAVVAGAEDDEGEVREARDGLLRRIVRRLGKWDEEVKDLEGAKVLFDLAERIRKLGGAEIGNAADAQIPNTIAEMAREVAEDTEVDEDWKKDREKAVRRARRRLEKRTVKVGKKLGNGQFGEVCEVKGSSGLPLCVKFLSGAGLAEAEHEAEIYQRIKDTVGEHPNIGSCFGVKKVVNRKGVEQDAIVLERHGGGTMEKGLQDARTMVERGLLTTEEYHAFMKGLLRGVVKGLIAMRDSGLGHLDIKSDNIMIGDDGEARLVDMGLSREHGETATGYFGHFQTFESGEDRDVFAVGATVFKEILGKTFRYNVTKQGIGANEILNEFRARGPGQTVQQDRANPTAFTDFVNRVLQPSGNPSLEDLLSDPFLSDAQPAPDVFQKIKDVPHSEPDADTKKRVKRALAAARERAVAVLDSREAFGTFETLARTVNGIEAELKRTFPFGTKAADLVEDTRTDLDTLNKLLARATPELLALPHTWDAHLSDGDLRAAYKAAKDHFCGQPDDRELEARYVRLLESWIAALAMPEIEDAGPRLDAMIRARSRVLKQIKQLPFLTERGMTDDLKRLAAQRWRFETQHERLLRIAASQKGNAPPSPKELKKMLKKAAEEASGVFPKPIGGLEALRDAWVEPIQALAQG